MAAHHTLIITPSLYLPQQSLLIVLFCVFGGMRYFWGAAAGAIVLGALPIYFSGLADWYQILYGVLFVVLMIVRPQGLIGSTDLTWVRRLLGRGKDPADQDADGRTEEKEQARCLSHFSRPRGSSERSATCRHWPASTSPLAAAASTA